MPTALNFAGGGFTLTAWVKFDGSTTHDTIVWKSGSFRVWKQNANLMASFDGVISDAIVVSGQMSTGTWQHIAVTYDGSRYIYGYLNGIRKNRISTSGSMTDSVDPLRLGWFTTVPHLQGALDNVRLYNTVLNPTEIAADMADDAPVAVPVEPFVIVTGGVVQTAIITPDTCDTLVCRCGGVADVTRCTGPRARRWGYSAKAMHRRVMTA